MGSTNQYRNVAEMLDGISDDRSLRDELEAYGVERQMTKFLSATRCAKGLSQDDIAKKLDCSQSCISKLENGVDADLKIGEVDRYLDAMGIDAGLFLKIKNATALDEIKHHVLAIKNLLEEVSGLSQPDDGSGQSIATAHVETLVNVAKVVLQSVAKIQIEGLDIRPSCHIELGFTPKDMTANSPSELASDGSAAPS